MCDLAVLGCIVEGGEEKATVNQGTGIHRVSILGRAVLEVVPDSVLVEEVRRAKKTGAWE